MLHESPMMRGGLRGWAALTLVVVGGMALGTLAGARVSVTSFERPRLVRGERDVSLAGRLAAVDAAIARNERSRAIYEWRDAYSLALGTRSWDAMIAVGDAALRMDVMAGHSTGGPTGLRAEARQAYLLALFRARDARAPEGIARVAEAFTALGDAEMAARARAIR
jgi:hypothetical protein